MIWQPVEFEMNKRRYRFTPHHPQMVLHGPSASGKTLVAGKLLRGADGDMGALQNWVSLANRVSQTNQTLLNNFLAMHNFDERYCYDSRHTYSHANVFLFAVCGIILSNPRPGNCFVFDGITIDKPMIVRVMRLLKNYPHIPVIITSLEKTFHGLDGAYRLPNSLEEL